MFWLVVAATVLNFQGEVVPEGGDYVLVPFEVPEGTIEIQVAHSDGSEANILDWGLWGPDGFRGWGGGLTDDAVVGVDESSRGYLPGPIAAGTWHVVIGKAKIASAPATYDITVTLRDEADGATLEPRPRAEPGPAALGGDARWYAGDLHVHSRESGDASATFEDIAALAQERGLDFVVLSDHNTVSQHALQAAFQEQHEDFLLVRGCEITTYGGHGGGLGISEYVDHRIGLEERSAAAMIEDVTAQGGAFVVNHPLLDLGDACIGCAWDHEDTPWDQVAGMEILTGPYDLWVLFGRPAQAMWDGLLDDGYRIAAVGGSDDHRAGMDLGATQSPIGSPTTVVYAESLSEEAILEGIRQGRVVVKLRGPDDPMAELYAEGPDGERVMMGDTIAAGRVTIEARVTGGDGTKLLLYKNGKSVDNVDVVGDDFTHRFEQDTSPDGDRYRVHVVDGADVTITNHVYVDFAELPGGDGEGEGEDDEGGCGCRTGSGGAGGGALVALAALVALRRRRRV